MIHRLILLATAAALAVGVAAQATADDEPAALPAAATAGVDFVRDVAPLFAGRCYKCHGPDEQEGSLRLDAKAIVMQGGQSGPLLEKGNSGGSLLIERVAGLGDNERMPPEGEPLTDREIGLIRAWIDQGAAWPEGFGAQATSVDPHWAYAPPKKATLPAVRDASWPKNPLDYFVLARLEKEGLPPSPKEEPAKLLRRVYLDLIGLPPGVEAVERFLADPSDAAYEEVVDRLLASPQYGERWARPWLDMVRYADSNGYQADQYREVWPYRDWVIRAINDGMPFDQFTIEQIAGDLLPDATLDQKIASGMHRLTTCNVEAGVDPEENRTNQVIDRVNVTGAVWLGSTVECAQCHNHKYDPFTQRDFYGLYAFFNNTPLEVKLNSGVQYNFYGPAMTLPLHEEEQKRRAELEGEHKELLTKYDQRFAEVLTELESRSRISRSQDEKQAQWNVLAPSSFTSEQGATHTILDDHSILVGGKNPDTDVYTVELTTDLNDISAIKIEGLLDPSLPGQGPGRQTQGNRANFVLTEFAAHVQPVSGEAEPTKLDFRHATADVEHPQFTIDKAYDGDSSTGWSIHVAYHQPHHAIFYPAKRIGLDGGTRLTLRLEHHYGLQRSIGRLRVSVLTGDPEEPALPDALAKVLATPAKKRNKKQQEQIETHLLEQNADIKQLKAEVDTTKKQLDAIQPPTSLVMVEMDKPRPTHIFKRGNFLDKGEPVNADTPAVLHPFPEDAPRNRLGLAQWLVDPANPLVGRAMVNRWWAEMFGQGLVETLEDLGTQGDAPTHPDLLDWLAADFVDSGWSMKHVHKRIVMSAAYRQSSRISSQLLARDPYNKLLARGPRFRMSAESVRDNALAIGGLLSKKMGGPPIYPPQPDGLWRHVGRNAPVYETSTDEDRFRRGIYVVWRRSAPYPSFTNFDAPDRAASCIKRPRTNTPLQALTLLNDPAYVEIARALAQRMHEHEAESAAEKIAHGFVRATSRRPKPEELSVLLSMYNEERKRLAGDGNASALLAGKDAPQGDAPQVAALFYVANTLLNLDETITK